MTTLIKEIDYGTPKSDAAKTAKQRLAELADSELDAVLRGEKAPLEAAGL